MKYINLWWYIYICCLTQYRTAETQIHICMLWYRNFLSVFLKMHVICNSIQNGKIVCLNPLCYCSFCIICKIIWFYTVLICNKNRLVGNRLWQADICSRIIYSSAEFCCSCSFYRDFCNGWFCIIFFCICFRCLGWYGSCFRFFRCCRSHCNHSIFFFFRLFVWWRLLIFVFRFRSYCLLNLFLRCLPGLFIRWCFFLILNIMDVCWLFFCQNCDTALLNNHQCNEKKC